VTLTRSVADDGDETGLLSLAEVEQQLWDWGVSQAMWNCARKRGMSRNLFVPSYHEFVETCYRQTNNRGEPAFGTIDRALYRGWIWLRDQTDYPSFKHKLKSQPEWSAVTTKSRAGKKLPWRIYVNDLVT
jgi:hypothetical protein